MSRVYRQLSLSEFLRMKNLQGQYHAGRRLSDDDISFLYRLIITDAISK